MKEQLPNPLHTTLLYDLYHKYSIALAFNFLRVIDMYMCPALTAYPRPSKCKCRFQLARRRGNFFCTKTIELMPGLNVSSSSSSTAMSLSLSFSYNCETTFCFIFFSVISYLRCWSQKRISSPCSVWRGSDTTQTEK